MLRLGGGLGLDSVPIDDGISILGVSEAFGKLVGNSDEVLWSQSDLSSMQFSFSSSCGRSTSNISMSNIKSSSKARVSMLAVS